MNEGVIMTAVLWKARQRNTREENKYITEDRGDELWQDEESDSDGECNYM